MLELISPVLSIIDTIYFYEGEDPSRMSGFQKRASNNPAGMKLPLGNKLSIIYPDIKSAILDLRSRFFDGYLQVENYITGEEGKVLFIDGRVIGAVVVNDNEVTSGEGALKRLLNFERYDIEVFEFDSLDVQIALELNRSKLEDLDSVFEDILTELNRTEQKFVNFRDIEEDEEINRDEILRKYRIRVPSDEDIERLLEENGF